MDEQQQRRGFRARLPILLLLRVYIYIYSPGGGLPIYRHLPLYARAAASASSRCIARVLMLGKRERERRLSEWIQPWIY